jgi:hypothetical protein
MVHPNDRPLVLAEEGDRLVDVLQDRVLTFSRHVRQVGVLHIYHEQGRLERDVRLLLSHDAERTQRDERRNHREQSTEPSLCNLPSHVQRTSIAEDTFGRELHIVLEPRTPDPYSFFLRLKERNVFSNVLLHRRLVVELLPPITATQMKKPRSRAVKPPCPLAQFGNDPPSLVKSPRTRSRAENPLFVQETPPSASPQGTIPASNPGMEV